MRTLTKLNKLVATENEDIKEESDSFESSNSDTDRQKDKDFKYSYKAIEIVVRDYLNIWQKHNVKSMFVRNQKMHDLLKFVDSVSRSP